jgi:glycosyltransferase involved in cell wall biosynthesis
MHILVTTDTVGGVWTYTRELVTGLLRRGLRVTLVSFGDIPALGQTRWMEDLRHSSRTGAGFTYFPTAFRLEWMQEAPADMEASAEYLRGVIRDCRPDLLHLNQFYYGTLESPLPRLVVAHSDVVSWWMSVYEQEPPSSSWLSWYRESVSRGLAQATQVVAPSRWMLEQIERHYGKPARGCVIHNGRTPGLFNPHVSKEGKILTVGRRWDAGKNAGLLLSQEMPAPVIIVGSDRHPEGRSDGWEEKPAAASNIRLQPRQDERRLVQLLGRAAIYAATSRYEPFGLAPLEAALSRCAIAASDIPSFRELWQGAAMFFRNNDAADLRRVLDALVRDPELCRNYGNLAYARARRQYTADRMVENYMILYQALAPRAMAAA